MTNRKMPISEKVERLTQIQEQLFELYEEAREIVRGTSEEECAKGYWLASIRCALDDGHSYLGKERHTMQETIDALDFEVEEENIRQHEEDKAESLRTK
jgi:hypothetical protein